MEACTSCVHHWTLAALSQVDDEKKYWYALDYVGEHRLTKKGLNSLGHVRLADLTPHTLWLGHINPCHGDVTRGSRRRPTDRVKRPSLLNSLIQQVQLVAAQQINILTLAGVRERRCELITSRHPT
ncbi:hypothetical protein CLCR_11018 [Cladophialophora carrionii]|uniref:Uncharacterized protein n=1 Tax=Cladophialophora carrionii TaxID=86049 RepID=A0A1C1CYX4_9EURO|nr:hypothetical protein CLCR_11018 [Cladophialophora carrionii]